VTTSKPNLQLTQAADLSVVERLLERNDLPAGDVRDKPDAFVVATVDGRRVGVGGIEQYGTEGLLRSVVVDTAVRGEGYGAALCDALEQWARDDGIERLSLLTTTAAEFFERRGYERIERDAAPAAVRETTQFSDLCPASATLMVKRIDDVTEQSGGPVES
jgi:amino-acid N-acetyltransferase